MCIFIQSLLYFLPIIAGGIADKYGYRKVFFFAFSCITLGYFLTSLTESYLFVFASLLIMAVGAGFFKPIISGTIAKTTDETNSTLGFGIFYWSINLGAFLFPLFLVPYLKSFGYEYIFIMAAIVGIIMFFINVIFYREPEAEKHTSKKFSEVFIEMASVLKDGKFISLILLYSCFWILYFQMYGTVLWYLKEQVDMTPINNAVNSFLSIFTSNPNWKFDTEHVTVINAGVIISLQILVSKILQKTPALPTMIFGIGLGTLGMFVLSTSNSPWIFIAGIIIFTLGEMNKPKLLWLIFTIIGILSIFGLMAYNKVIKSKEKN